jgi:hypothetical protein
MKYLSITGARSEQELQAYLYSYATVITSNTASSGRVYAVVSVPDERAQYQADRMSSGMMGCGIHDTATEAGISCLDRI